MNCKCLSSLLIFGCILACPLVALTPIGSRLPPAGYNLDPDKDKVNTWNQGTIRDNQYRGHDHRSRSRVINNYYYPYYSTYPYSTTYYSPYYSSPYGYPYEPHDAFPDASRADELFDRLSD